MSGWNIFYGLINFAILAGALFLIGRKTVKGIFGRHRDEVAQGLEQSEKAAETAQELLQSLPQVTARGEEDLAQIGREGEAFRVLTLGELRNTPVDMFTTVFIGNSQTCSIGGKMVTPRGYRLG